MSSFKITFSNLLLTLCLLVYSSTYGEDVVVRAPNGSYIKMNIEPEDSFASVMQQIEAVLELSEEEQELYFDGQEETNLSDQVFYIDFSANVNGYAALTATPRNYNAAVTQSEKNDIGYIVKTLGNSSLKSIWNQEKDLKKAGDRINHVHPLRFLMTVFTDEELKVGIRNIRNRGGKVWDNFIKGLKESLVEEAQRSNMKPEYIQDFAKVVGINPSLLLPSVQASRWGDFVDVLIDKVPRKGDSGRYDI